MSQSNTRVVYSTDEDVAIRCGADFALICPPDQVVASATDGVIASTDRWILSSATTNFVASGVQPGMMVQLLKPVAQFQPPGAFLVVEAVSASGVQLRRKGQVARIGQPPSPASGLTNIQFVVITLGPQLSRASAEVDRRLGIDSAIPGRSSTDVKDPTPLRDAVVLTILSQQYLALSRSGSPTDSLASKAALLRAELDQLFARLSLGWINGDGPISRFNTRIER